MRKVWVVVYWSNLNGEFIAETFKEEGVANSVFNWLEKNKDKYPDSFMSERTISA